MQTKSKIIKDAIKSYIEQVGNSGESCPSYKDIIALSEQLKTTFDDLSPTE